MSDAKKLEIEIEKTKNYLTKDNKFFEDILSFDFYNYRLENLVKKIKSKNYKNALKICN